MSVTQYALLLLCRWCHRLHMYNAKGNRSRCVNQIGYLLDEYQCLDECKYVYGKPVKDNWLSSSQNISWSNKIQLQVREKTIHVVHFMKNLGMYFWYIHACRETGAISSACYYHICNTGHIRQYIVSDACKTLTHTFVASWLAMHFHRVHLWIFADSTESYGLSGDQYP